MRFRAFCPNNPEHKRFITVAHVSEDWIVDEWGDFLKVALSSEGQTVSGPNPDNTWTCEECGATASMEGTT